jgi:tetratricopeptide (TPR) repeat protein
MCFPHVDASTRELLTSVMEIADNYADFTERLCERVCSESSSSLVEYLTYFFAFHISEYNLIDRLVAAGKVNKMAEPLHLIVKFRRGEAEDLPRMNQAVIDALSAAPNDWIASQIYLKWRIYAELNFHERDRELRVIDRIDQIVNTRKDLEFFKSYLLRIKGIRLMFDFRTEEEIEVAKEALEIAKKYDDQVSVVDILSVLGGMVKFTDIDEGMKFLDATKALAEKLGYEYRVGRYHLGLGHLLGQKYEIDAAIEHILEFHRIRQSIGLSERIMNTLLSFYFNLKGDGVEALRRIDMAQRSTASLRNTSSFAIAQRAYALTNLGRFSEAKAELEASRELALRSGSGWDLFLWYQMVEGILEKEMGNLVVATSLLEDVLNYQEDEPVPIIRTICLVNLTEIEIELLTTESLDKPPDSSGPWMEMLESRVEENNYPGVEAQLLILKAKLLDKKDRGIEAMDLLKEVKKIALLPGLKYLENIIAMKFPHIFVK